ncbi:MAG: ACP S-malonyltransferase [Gemmatimonadota bacterium]|nr:ACP S-malonyltransferase [Gemmatimonadota bacterium]MDE3171939.1 ACP S-malonyltransferase [Gemmatimonadota bacterium]MDE3216573.1 ACP S-malonyltransferase [Gemmatimonadota bacterium]
MEFVLVFPGQGSQAPGMGKALAAAHPAAREVFAAVDDALAAPLGALCFEGPAEELTLTHNAQPALLAHGAAVWAVVRDALAGKVRAAAGHSLGEFTAYHAAGALGLAAAARLVRRRGQLMFESGVRRPGAMAAILGDTLEPIAAICERATAEAALVVPANYNSPGQVVISGEEAGVERAMLLARELGAKRAIRLNVSGAFHSPLMETAVDGLSEALDKAEFTEAQFPIYSNVTADAGVSAGRARELLLKQLTSPVRWTDEVVAMAAAHPQATFVEMGPGSVLVGLLKKIAPQLRTMTCGTPGDVDTLLGLAVA